MPALENATLRQLFLDARTHHHWRKLAVDDAVLRRLYELVRMGPTAKNCQPVRLVFVKSNEAKARLRASLSPGNLEKAMAAPVTTIVAYDVEFYDKLTKLVPYAPDAKLRVSEMEPEARRRMALMNATLQCGYAIVAARSLGLDCGPMGGFNAETLDAEFFPDHQWKSILLLNLGHGEPSTLHPRAPRLDFDEACRIV